MNILKEAEKLVDGDRQKSYGSPQECMLRTARILAEITGLEMDDEQIVLFNVAQKLARLSANYQRDTVIDICGYLYILADKLREGK